MSIYPSKAELLEIQEHLTAVHKKMHEFAKRYPKNESEFIRIAIHATDSVWKLDEMIKTAEHVERLEKKQ